jgi:ankyrin repeat protein
MYVSCPSEPPSLDPSDPSQFSFDNLKYSPTDGKLFDAVKQFNISAVETALEDDANPNVSDKIGQSALMWACWYGQKDIVELLIKHKDTVQREKDKKFKAPLQPDINSTSKKSYLYTAIHCAAYQGDKDIFKCLINEYKGKINLKVTDANGENIVHKIAKSGKIELLEYMWQDQRNTYNELKDAVDNNNSTPLHIAVRVGNAKMVEKLLEFRADPAIASKGQRPIYPLYSAYRSRQYNIFVLLLTYMKPEDIDKVYYPEATNEERLEDYLKRIEAPEGTDSVKPLQQKYSLSLWRRRHNGATGKKDNPIAIPEFTQAVEEFHKAVREGEDLEVVRDLAQNIIDDATEDLQSVEEPLLISALKNNKQDVVEYLLKAQYKTRTENDLLCTAAELARQDPAYNRILKFLLKDISKHEDLKRLNGHDASNNTALMFIVRNKPFLESCTWDDIERILLLFSEKSRLATLNLQERWVISDIIDLDWESLIRDKMFYFVCNNVIAKGLSTPDSENKWILHELYSKNYLDYIDYLLGMGVDHDVHNTAGKTLLDMINEDLELLNTEENKDPERIKRLEELQERVGKLYE